MINQLLSALGSGNPRVQVHWNKMLYDYQVRNDVYRTKRFLLAPVVQTRLVNMLKFILLSIDVPYLLKNKNDQARFLEVLDTEVDNLRTIFDPVWRGNLIKNTFVKVNSGIPVREIIVSTKHNLPLINLPMGKDWPAWKQTRPVRILHHDSRELQFNLQRFHLRFREDVPSYVIASIDIATLLLKYLKHRDRDDHEVEDEGMEAEHFIHYHVINDFYEDLIRIWILNHMSDLLDQHANNSNFELQPSLAHPLIMHAGYQHAMRNCYNEMKLAINCNIRMEDFLRTLWFPGYNIIDWLRTMQREVVVPNHRQYAFAEVLMTMPWVNFIVKLATLRGRNYPDNRRIHQRMRLLIEQYHRDKIWQRVAFLKIDKPIEKLVIDTYQWVMLNP